MTKNVYTIVSYNNYEIKILAFIINEGKSYLIYDEFVDKVDVTKFTSDFDKDALSAKINEAVEESLKFTKQEKKDVYLVFDAHEFFFETKSLSFDFKDEHEINNTDIKKIYTNAMSNVGPKDGFTPVNFQLKNIIVNDDREVKSPVGMTVNKMTAIGEMVFADYTTTSAIKSVVSRYDINIVDSYVGGYLLNTESAIMEGQGIMEVSTERINFAVNTGDDLKQFSIDFGFRKILETTYDNLIKEYSPADSEDAVRFLMEYFPVKKYNTEASVIGDIKLDKLIGLFNDVILDYFNYIFKELRNKNINCHSYRVLLHDYDVKEFIGLLNSRTDFNFEELHVATHRRANESNVKASIASVKINEKIKRVEN